MIITSCCASILDRPFSDDGDPILNFPSGINISSNLIPFPRSSFSSTSFCKLLAASFCISFAFASLNGATNKTSLVGITGAGSGLIFAGTFTVSETIFRTKRKPTPVKRLTGALKKRFAQRSEFSSLLLKEPPRNTRNSPTAGPFGFVTRPSA